MFKLDQIFPAIFLKSGFGWIGTSFLKHSKCVISLHNRVLRGKPSISLHNGFVRQSFEIQITDTSRAALLQAGQGSWPCSESSHSPSLPSQRQLARLDVTYVFTTVASSRQWAAPRPGGNESIPAAPSYHPTHIRLNTCQLREWVSVPCLSFSRINILKQLAATRQQLPGNDAGMNAGEHRGWMLPSSLKLYHSEYKSDADEKVPSSFSLQALSLPQGLCKDSHKYWWISPSLKSLAGSCFYHHLNCRLSLSQ